MASRTFQGPRGTRDVYPEDMLRRRYLLQTWRDTSIRHGFEEIEGPTFEEAELYAVKSGEGILGELFQAFSGKSPEEVEQVMATGRAPFAMRPEFTPTLARMYAARARQLPKPTRWFMAGPFFRAERPQRGRLREFLQWNCDVLGLPGDVNAEGSGGDERVWVDVAAVDTCVESLRVFGLDDQTVRVGLNDREAVSRHIASKGVAEHLATATMALLDRRAKMPAEAMRAARIEAQLPEAIEPFLLGSDSTFRVSDDPGLLSALSAASAFSLSSWITLDDTIVRGLAYYTGTVFEVIAEGERAVAGGGRYDNLIELLGGPPTPAVGFAMGDVVLSLLLEDKGLMPEGPELMDALSRRPASLRPEAFVIGANDDASDAPVRRLVADLRRGVESPAYLEREGRKPWHADRYGPAQAEGAPSGVRPLHARSSDKSTRNLKKLLNDAERQFARFAVILHGDGSDPGRVQIKDMDARQDLTPADVPGLPADIAEFSTDPASPVYAGRAISALLG